MNIMKFEIFIIILFDIITLFFACAVNLISLNTVYLLFLVLILLYYFILPALFDKMDICSFKRYKEKNTENNIDINVKNKISKTGILKLTAIFLLYMAALWAILTICGYKKINFGIILLVILSAMLIFNSIFIHTKFCLIKLMLFKNINCCNDCYVMGSGYILLFAPLIYVFGLNLSQYVRITAGLILIWSLYNSVIWFIFLFKKPERFFRETNAKLNCSNCLKKKKGACTSYKKHEHE